MKGLLFILVILFIDLISNAQVAEEKNGYVCVEAETFTEQINDDIRKWYMIDKTVFPAIAEDNLLEGASNVSYIEVLPDTRKTHDDELINGKNFCKEAGKMAIISYPVKFNTTGKYYIWVRTHSTGSEDNGVHVGIDGQWPESGQRMQWCEGKQQWTWDSKQRTNEVHCGVEKLIYLNVDEPGMHTIQFSMREDGFSMDHWCMSLDYINPDDR